MIKISNVTAKELLGLPICDLVRIPLSEFRSIFQKKVLPNDDVMGALDHILITRILHILDRNDQEEIKRELDQLRRLIPYTKREELNARETNWGEKLSWAARIETLGDVLETALDILEDIPKRERFFYLHNRSMGVA